MNIRRTLLVVSVALLPALPAAAAEACKARVLHTVPLVVLRDSRVAFPVTFGATAGALIVDSATVADPGTAGARKSVPVTGSNLEERTVQRTSYAGIAGELTLKTVEALGLTPNETGNQFNGPAGVRRERKVSVPQLSIHGLAPFSTDFLVADSSTRSAAASGNFAINNYRQFNFDLDLDLPARTAKLFSREVCGDGQPGDWAAPAFARVTFTVDGNGYIRIPVLINGKKVEAVLDTGSVGTTLDFGYASRTLGVRENDPALTKVAELADGRVVYSRPFASIGFEGVTVADAPLHLVPGIRGRSEGAPTGSRVDRDKRGTLPPLVLGMSVLRHFRVFFAFDEKAIYVANSTAPAP